MMIYWETSQRPLLVKTVWIGGYRHAILSESEQMESGPQKHKKHKLTITENGNETIAIPLLSAYVQKISPQKPTITKIQTPRSIASSKNANLPFTLKKDFTSQNILSERVLQWLDLAGQEFLKYNIKEKLPLRHSISETRENHYSSQIEPLKNNFKTFNFDIEPLKSKTNTCRNVMSHKENFSCKNSLDGKKETSKCYTPDQQISSSTEETESDSYEDCYENYFSEDLFTDADSTNIANVNQMSYTDVKNKNFNFNYSTITRKKLHIFIPFPQ